jgi:hypothetical protein
MTIIRKAKNLETIKIQKKIQFLIKMAREILIVGIFVKLKKVFPENWEME